MSKTRIVLDSNVILSAALFKASPTRQALDKAINNGQVILSEPTLAELYEICERPKFDKYLSKISRDQFLHDFIAVTENVEIVERFSACRDRKDDKFLELAVNGNADLIITGDRDLLVLNPFRNIKIITPSYFLENI